MSYKHMDLHKLYTHFSAWPADLQRWALAAGMRRVFEAICGEDCAEGIMEGFLSEDVDDMVENGRIAGEVAGDLARRRHRGKES